MKGKALRQMESELDLEGEARGGEARGGEKGAQSQEGFKDSWGSPQGWREPVKGR